MALARGTRIGSHEIVAPLGAGGMGEVYRARDTRLNPDVARKVLPHEFTLDPDRLARFTREAQLLASLNHPNIAAIYGLEETAIGNAQSQALVLELVEGPTLADRVAAGPMPIDESLGIARQIAEALEADHEQGIVHRDLKPANIKVTPDGVVKVLDFGLAKLTGPAEAGHYAAGGSVRLQADPTVSPTITSPAMMTGVGMLMGTAAYMSPEQAKGRAADKRSDIWAFGCVLYEMLTGKGPFAGDDVGDTLANVLKREPDWTALPAEVPPALRALLRRCLEKDRRERVADISTALFVLKEQASLAAPVRMASVAPLPRRPLWRRVAVLSTGALVVAVVATTLTWFAARAGDTAPPHVTRTTITTSGPAALTINGAERVLTVSPDGTHVVYVGNGGTQLFVRALDALEPVAIASGAALRAPFVSPDGQWVGFLDGGM